VEESTDEFNPHYFEALRSALSDAEDEDSLAEEEGASDGEDTEPPSPLVEEGQEPTAATAVQKGTILLCMSGVPLLDAVDDERYEFEVLPGQTVEVAGEVQEHGGTVMVPVHTPNAAGAGDAIKWVYLEDFRVHETNAGIPVMQPAAVEMPRRGSAEVDVHQDFRNLIQEQVLQLLEGNSAPPAWPMVSRSPQLRLDPRCQAMESDLERGKVYAEVAAEHMQRRYERQASSPAAAKAANIAALKERLAALRQKAEELERGRKADPTPAPAASSAAPAPAQAAKAPAAGAPAASAAAAKAKAAAAGAAAAKAAAAKAAAAKAAAARAAAEAAAAQAAAAAAAAAATAAAAEAAATEGEDDSDMEDDDALMANMQSMLGGTAAPAPAAAEESASSLATALQAAMDQDDGVDQGAALEVAMSIEAEDSTEAGTLVDAAVEGEGADDEEGEEEESEEEEEEEGDEDYDPFSTEPTAA